MLNRTIVTILLGAAALFMATAFFLPNNITTQFLSYALISVSVTLIVGYAPAMWDGITQRQLKMVGMYALGACLPWMAILLNRAWIQVARISNADWMMHSPVVAVSWFLFLLAGIVQVLSPGVANGRIPRHNLLVVGLLLGIAASISLAVWAVNLGVPPIV